MSVLSGFPGAGKATSWTIGSGGVSERRLDHLVIESTGISELLPVAETFTFRDADGSGLAAVARLDAMSTLVDAMNSGIDLDRAAAASRSVASRLASTTSGPSRTCS